MGAVHEKGPFQSISFAVEIDLRWSEIIFQIKAMFQKKKKGLKNQTHTQPTKVCNLKIQRNRGIKFSLQFQLVPAPEWMRVREGNRTRRRI